MCGIAGYVSAEPSCDREGILERMTDVIAHRGPDNCGYYHDPYAHLGHRRLSIIDVAAGHQPMANETRSQWIVFNGEIFNHSEIRPRLEQAGHWYKTRCDTETLIHAYEEFGTRSVDLFRGMFAYAIWNCEKRQLFAARDRLGIKPFYYYWDGQTFAFASEIKALLMHPVIRAELEEQAVPEYLAFGYISDDRTLFHGIRKLLPGHCLMLDVSGIRPKLEAWQYWDVPVPRPAKGAEQDLVAETRRRLEESVRLHVMSDVPLGMFLSGGVDSSAIAALTSRMTGTRVQTFAVGYREEEFTELAYAARVAQAIGTDHHEVTLGRNEFFDELPRLIWNEDEPITWPSSVSLYFVSRLAAARVKVVLTGEGSDEIFGGYERYRWNLLNSRGAHLYGLVPAFIRQAISAHLEITPLLNASVRRKLRHTFMGREPSVESLLLDNFYCAFSQEDQKQFLGATPRSVYANYLRYWNARKRSSLLAHMLYADQKTYLVQLLMKQDRMSMAASIESRVPFLDHPLVEFSTTIPDSLKIRGKAQKYILKRAVADLLPPEIIHRSKMGFPTPLRKWLLDREAKPIYDGLQDRNGFLASVIELRALGGLIQRHLSRDEDATDRVWRLLNLQLWGELFITGRRSHWRRGVSPLHDIEAPVAAER